MNKPFFIDPTVEILPAKDDQIFKSLLTRSEPESKIVLMDLIGSIIGRKVTDVVIKNNEPATMDVSQKQERLDVNCEIDGKEIVNIEMQSSYIKEIPDTEHRNLKNKSVLRLRLVFVAEYKGQELRRPCENISDYIRSVHGISETDRLQKRFQVKKHRRRCTDRRYSFHLHRAVKAERSIKEACGRDDTVGNVVYFLGVC